MNEDEYLTRLALEAVLVGGATIPALLIAQRLAPENVVAQALLVGIGIHLVAEAIGINAYYCAHAATRFAGHVKPTRPHLLGNVRCLSRKQPPFFLWRLPSPVGSRSKGLLTVR